jgi:hypothetical protein
MRKNTHLYNRNNFYYQDIVNKLVDNCTCSNISSKYPLYKANISYKIDMFEHNIIKAQKSILVKSIFSRRLLISKHDTFALFYFDNHKKRNIASSLMLFRYLNGMVKFGENMIVFSNQDSLLTLSKLNYNRVNLNVFGDFILNIKILYNFQLFKDLIFHENCLKKR